MRLLRDLSDDRLVDLFRAGRADAFGALYDRYRLRLVRFARRIRALVRRSSGHPVNAVINR